MDKTPRTEEVVFRSGMEHEYVEADFARQLERELEQARYVIEQLTAERNDLARRIGDQSGRLAVAIAERDACRIALRVRQDKD